MGEIRETLLVKQEVYYHKNCPGCKVDKRKAENPNIPWIHFFFVWIITLSTALPISSIFPFLYYLTRDFHIAKREEDISFYAGFVGCAFLFGRFLTAVHWGIIADRYGRKPVIIISVMAVVVFNTTFGLSTHYWMALTSRFLLGAVCGVMGPIRAYITEVSRREHQAIGVSMIASSWGIGLVVGPAIGGYLAQPAEKYPSLFSQDSIFGRFPYFLGSLVISVFSLFVFGICFWLPETLHSHPAEDDTIFASEDVEKPAGTEKGTSDSWLSLLKNRPLMSTITLYGIFQMHDLAYSEIFSLWALSPRTLGGLGFQTNDVGNALATAGVGLLLCQLFLYPFLERVLGPMSVSRVGAVVSIIQLACYPFMANLTGTTLKLAADLNSAIQNVLATSITTGMFLLQNRTVSQAQRGTANGLSLCIVSLANAVGPAAAGTM
ncbi:hypothetical protein RND81_05G175600 [Saponaria officinalis]|uniref:Major facilitator superfamily (MFS) profile domain-containing protein n=1 Tax=Saponaria officinalis TaxID=3572 RepID=A0AAW1KX02_SAPOF